MTKQEVKEFLDELFYRFNRSEFIEDDPISVAHRFETRADIEIAGFLAATIAWGNRKIIVRNAHRMMDLMGGEPARFVMEASPDELSDLEGFVHRTFSSGDLQYFVHALRRIYLHRGGLEGVFCGAYEREGDIRVALAEFYDLFFEELPLERSGARRHLSSIAKGSACKRLCMFLRWMVRRDNAGVDLGLWNDRIPASALYLPLDVHSGNTSRSLGILTRRANDWKAVEEVTSVLREFDHSDPIKYDYSLFCAGIEGYKI